MLSDFAQNYICRLCGKKSITKEEICVPALVEAVAPAPVKP